ncbi:hypothetical protein RCCS2_03884 [Roseobacter sp. CCS2]|nr:hypothetical protein RCCS2_03884 [Roseobacter sp. CCS2]
MAQTLQQMVDEVREAMGTQMRIRGRSLDVQLRKAGRLLPRRIRQDATYLAQGVTLVQNPKLAKMVDMAKAQQAYENVMAHLHGFDVAAGRRNAVLNLVASIAFALLVTGVLLLVVLWWRGFI